MIQPCINRQLPLSHGILQKNAGGLSQNLTEDHARDDGIAGKMALQKEFASPDRIMADGSPFPVFHIVKEHHMIPVRQYCHDLFSVHILTS